ncbi:MAG: NAD(P)-dependent oxidoreductase [Ignavibacteria bacterium]
MSILLYKIRSRIIKSHWATTDKIKVLIETNKYFTKEAWGSILNKTINDAKVEVMFCANKYEGYKLIKDAQVMFSFGDNNYYNKSKLHLQYYGISQPDISTNSIANVYYAKGIPSSSVAEYCLAFSLIALNDFGKYFRYQQQNKWQQEIIFSESSTLSGKIIGVVGLGNNGRKIAEIFRKLGCQVYGYDIMKDAEKDVDVFCGSIGELLESSDIVISAVSLTPETQNLFNKESFLKMKENAILINVSRGGVINERDLYLVLKSNRIACAVLDVTVNEPLSRYSKLWSLDNLIITPHISGNINKYSSEVMEDFAGKLNQFIDTYV